MAINYKLSEVVEIFAKGTDMDAMQDIGRRFPLLAIKVATILATSNESFADLMKHTPDYLTANKMNSSIKNATPSDEDVEDTEVEEEVEVKEEKKTAKGGKGKGKGKKKEEVVEEDEEDEEANPYAGKNAMQLFKEAKERGLKAAPKKPAKYYIDMLLKDDAAKADTAEDADDWGDEEEEEEKPAKQAKGGKGKGKGKAKPVEDEEDDDWDI